MYKQVILAGVLFMVAACGQKNHAASASTDKDSVTAGAKTNTQNVEASPDNDTTVRVKHEAFNEDITDLPPGLAQFVPEGYTAIDTSYGNLNLDQYQDMIMVLKQNGEDTASDVDNPEKRPLLVLVGQPDNSFQLAARNDNVVLCINCGGAMGDPFTGVTIKNGYFSAEHYGGSAWRWTHIITFKYSPADKNWFLHKIGYESFHALNPKEATSRTETTKDFGTLPFEKFDVYKEDK